MAIRTINSISGYPGERWSDEPLKRALMRFRDDPGQIISSMTKYGPDIPAISKTLKISEYTAWAVGCEPMPRSEIERRDIERRFGWCAGECDRLLAGTAADDETDDE